MQTRDTCVKDDESKFLSSTSGIVRKSIVVAVIATGFIAVAFVFWKQEMKYSLPTPVPHQYTVIHTGECVQLPLYLKTGTAYFLHFYNPECPCSRFNAKHIRLLIGDYSDSIQFVIVVAEASSLEKAKREFGDDLNYIHDVNLEIAKACGVYSTPQAAIVTDAGRLYYPGNYNAARYCTARASNFAELSLVALINNQPPPPFGIPATQSYGCELDRPDIELF